MSRLFRAFDHNADDQRDIHEFEEIAMVANVDSRDFHDMCVQWRISGCVDWATFCKVLNDDPRLSLDNKEIAEVIKDRAAARPQRS